MTDDPGYLATFEPSMRLALDVATQAPRAAGGLGEGGPGRGEGCRLRGVLEVSRGITGVRADAGGASADVPVGAVVLGPDNAVLGRGRNRCLASGDPTAHAEIVAIRQAAKAARSWRLDGCTLVVTLEPCTMCAGAVRAARIGRLVYGAPDPRAGAAGSLWDLVRDRRLGPPVEVIGGVLAAPCAALLSEFFESLR